MVRAQIMLSDIPEPDVFTQNCPTQQILDIIADKWSVIVLYCLAYRPRRYSEIHRKIEGISQKVLTQTLRKLEQNGLVKRTVLSEMPPSVEYSMSPLGSSLVEPLLAIASWSRHNFPQVMRSREQYEQRNKQSENRRR